MFSIKDRHFPLPKLSASDSDIAIPLGRTSIYEHGHDVFNLDSEGRKDSLSPPKTTERKKQKPIEDQGHRTAAAQPIKATRGAQGLGCREAPT